MKRKRRSWVAFFGLFLFVILGWAAAFLAWLFWEDIRNWGGAGTEKTVSEPSRKPAEERISEEDRKKLDEILKRK